MLSGVGWNRTAQSPGNNHSSTSALRRLFKIAHFVGPIFGPLADSNAPIRTDRQFRTFPELGGKLRSLSCQRYLGDMGVSLQVWVHAMETPRDKLFVLKTDELRSLNLVTAAGVVPATPPSHPGEGPDP